MRFSFFSHNSVSLDREVRALQSLAQHLPEAERPVLITQTLADLPHEAREDILRQAYLDIEGRLLRHGVSAWHTTAELRAYVKKRFGLDHAVPSRFTVLFLEKSAQLFFLFRFFVEELWRRAGWQGERAGAVLREAAPGTPLALVEQVSAEGWARAFRAFTRLPQDEQSAVIADAFGRVISRSYRDFIRERGESQARVTLEEIVRAIQGSFGALEGIAGLVNALPVDILQEERLAFAPREELVETVSRQMRELRGKNVALFSEAQKLQETIRDLKEANAQTQSMAHAQEDFISVVSHQFRTPLAAIRWEAEALLDAAGKDPHLEFVRETAYAVRNRSAFLIGVLQNIFDLLAIESGTYMLRPSKGDLSALIQKSCDDFAKDAQWRGITLRSNIAESSLVTFDSTAIERVMHILLANAMQYSDKGNTVEVEMEVHAHGSEREFVVRVRDEGIGIRAEDRPRIFEKFFRTYNAKTKIPDGAGVALYIAKRIIELHHGKMSLESKGIGTGATFSFAIPELGAAEANAEEQAKPKYVPKPMGKNTTPPEGRVMPPRMLDPLLGE